MATDDHADGRDRVRAGVLGASKAAHLQVIEGGASEADAGQASTRKRGGGGKGGGKEQPARPTPESTCPVLALGQDEEGNFVFLQIDGKQAILTARQLGSRMDVARLFLGDDTWLRGYFPKYGRVPAKNAAGEDTVELKVVAFNAPNAGEFFMRRSRAAGQFGPHVVMRKPGIWPDRGGIAVHCGDQILMRGGWRNAGFREKDSDLVWPSLPKTPRPGNRDSKGTPIAPIAEGFDVGPEVARRLQEDIRDLWSLRRPGGEIILVGLVGLGYLGAAPPWRSNGFVMGPAESGKSALMALLRAMAPLHHYTNDTSKAGLEQNVGGRAMPIFVDEASDRVDPRNAQALMDMVLAATGGEGARGHRGGADGVGRAISLIGVIILGAVNPPDMKEQHRRRFTLVELRKAEAGADHLARVREATERATLMGPGLWARALLGFDRWRAALAAFRVGLVEWDCSPGEMDQLGAILAAWWVLTQDGVPGADGVRDGCGGVSEYIRGAEMVAMDDAPRRLIQHISSINVQQDRSTNLEPIGELVDQAFSTDHEDQPAAANRWLQRNGIRVVRADDGEFDRQKRPIPRAAAGDGLWFAPRAKPLRDIMRGSDFEGDRFTYELMRLPSALAWTRKNVRIGGYSGPAIWISRNDWNPPPNTEKL